VATYTRLESPDTPPEPRVAAGRRPAVAGQPRRSRWEAVLASGFVDERYRSVSRTATQPAAPAAGMRSTPSGHASTGCVARRVHGS
jgi:hypothetical protein